MLLFPQRLAFSRIKFEIESLSLATLYRQVLILCSNKVARASATNQARVQTPFFTSWQSKIWTHALPGIIHKAFVAMDNIRLVICNREHVLHGTTLNKNPCGLNKRKWFTS